MRIAVKFAENDKRIAVKFGDGIEISEGVFDRGYSEGYTEGYNTGYAEGEASGGSDFPTQEFFAKTCKELVMSGVTILGAYSFYQYNSLETVYLPDVTEIASMAFNTCANLSTVIMGEGLITIGGSGTSVFSSCPKIVSLEIPSTVETIGWNAFTGCTNLETVTFLGKPTTIGSLFNSTVLPSSVKTINVPWSEGEVTGAPWGAPSAKINYNHTRGD